MPAVLALIFFALGFVLLIKQFYLIAAIFGVFAIGLLLQTRGSQVIEFDRPASRRKGDL